MCVCVWSKPCTSLFAIFCLCFKWTLRSRSDEWRVHAVQPAILPFVPFSSVSLCMSIEEKRSQATLCTTTEWMFIVFDGFLCLFQRVHSFPFAFVDASKKKILFYFNHMLLHILLKYSAVIILNGFNFFFRLWPFFLFRFINYFLFIYYLRVLSLDLNVNVCKVIAMAHNEFPRWWAARTSKVNLWRKRRGEMVKIGQSSLI